MISRARALRDALLCAGAAVTQSPWFYAAAGALIATSLLAQEPDPEDAARAVAKDAETLRESLGDATLDDRLPDAQTPDDEALANVELLLKRSRPSVDAALDALEREFAPRPSGADGPASTPPASTPPASTPPDARRAAEPAPKRYLVFMSEALGEGALAAVDDLARARGDMEIVFRGLREGETIEAFAARRLAGRSAAPATIDPRPFREHGVEQVPAILDRETDRLVRGVADPDALDSRADGETLGPVVAISEVDLAEVMKARAVAIDWQARMRAAVGRYFQRTRFESVKPAVVTRVRRIDARVRLASDFVLPDGRVVARAGDLFDPSERQPLTLTLIVFNPRDDAEADLVAALLPDVDKPVLIATEVEALQGWESLGRLRERYGEPVHLLTPDLRRRFAIERTVSVVTGGEGWFEVREIAADARDAERAP